MSILHSISRAIAADSLVTIDLWLLGLMAISVGIAVYVRALPPRRVSGIDRLVPGRPAWLLTAVLFMSLCVYLFTISLYSTLKYPPAQAATQPARPPNYSAVDNAFFSTVPGILGFCAMLLGDRFVRRTTGHDLGSDLRRLPSGTLQGLVGVLIVVPPLFLLEQLLESVYRWVHFEHPTEHPLLHVLGQRPNPLVTGAIIFGACVVAPLFEELVFRGHLQTLLRRMFAGLLRPNDLDIPMATRLEEAEVVKALPPTVIESASRAGPNSWSTWAAILVTSIAFASVHPAWSQPIIFALSVCLGYAYERTGNLWVPVTIHAVFNTISTAIFLSGLGTR
jgi:membrane protease YdiL (CAAX protease family)